MTRLRHFRNSDMPALAALWNRWAPGRAVARPLSVHEFDAHLAANPLFDALGLIVAERDGAIVGFSHAGFGPENLDGPPWRLSHDFGAVVMLVVEPSPDAQDLARQLLDEAQGYLRERGASVLYAGGQYPVNPFYWGIYGGSEFAGILGAAEDSAFGQAVLQAGYQLAGEAVLLELDLTAPEPKDPRAVLIARSTKTELFEDVVPANWWQSLAVGEYQPSVIRLMNKNSPVPTELARASLWDMDNFGRLDGRSRIGLFGMEVNPAHRRQGHGRFLVNKVARMARDQGIMVLCVQTASTNAAALALYQSVGFTAVETARLYRLPGAGS